MIEIRNLTPNTKKEPIAEESILFQIYYEGSIALLILSL